MFTKEDLVYVYTRQQAIEDGEQVDVSSLAKEAGFKYPVFITRTIFDKYIKPDEEALSYGQDKTGRIWDVLTVLRFENQHKRFRQGNTEQEILFHVLFVMGSKRQKVQLKATVGALDIDDPQPAITIMLPEED
ncbi:MAG: DUF6573 family protein [Thermodesulfobacteriota bacterium]